VIDTSEVIADGENARGSPALIVKMLWQNKKISIVNFLVKRQGKN
jgi:hypothetical protein